MSFGGVIRASTGEIVPPEDLSADMVTALAAKASKDNGRSDAHTRLASATTVGQIKAALLDLL